MNNSCWIVRNLMQDKKKGRGGKAQDTSRETFIQSESLVP